jgi:hypothetical protein
MPGGTGEPAGLCRDRTAIGRGTLRLCVSHVVLVQRCNLTISTVQYCIFVQFNLNFGPGRAAENDIVGLSLIAYTNTFLIVIAYWFCAIFDLQYLRGSFISVGTTRIEMLIPRSLVVECLTQIHHLGELWLPLKIER